MKLYNKAILPLGFEAAGVASGIKKSGKLDLALFYSQVPAKAACLFTANKIQAAPIHLNKKHLRRGNNFQAIIANSGNANCFTGNKGLKDAQETAAALAKALNLDKKSVLVASTGIIGRPLPLVKIQQAIPKIFRELSKSGIDKAKKAILTTDTFTKEMTVKLNLSNRVVTICGITKGAGMIAPDMASPERSRGATMLCFIFTDAQITRKAFKKALDICVEKSFNCITVDGCMSTNDSVMALANGRAENNLIDVGRNFHSFVRGLSIVCGELAKLIVRDAEGASKFIRIKVNGAKSFQDARKIALAIANSNLFKTAAYGQNPNFGRIAASAGASGVDINENELKIALSPLDKKEININVTIKRGSASATVYTSDLTPEYIKINAEYN